MRPARLLSSLSIAALAAGLAGCPVTPVPAGNLVVPGALAAALTPSGDYIIFIADGDGEDLKAFRDSLKQAHNFVRGPNDINALSIPLDLTMNGQVLSTFRANRLAGGDVEGSGGATLGYVIATGTASRLAVVEAQDFTTTLSTTDARKCAAGGPGVSCLPEPAVDVVVSGKYPATGMKTQNAYALLAPDSTGAQSIIAMTASVDPSLDVPVVDFSGGPFALPVDPTGDGSHAVYARFSLSSDSSTLYVSRLDESQVLEVDPGTGAVTGILEPTQPALQGLGIYTSIVSPTYSATVNSKMVTEPSFILAVLADGEIVTLDPSKGAGPGTAVPATAVDDNMNPLSPLNFGVFAQDGVFVPCQSGDATCTTTVRTGTGSTVATPAAAFIALGTGTAAAIQPLNSGHPQIFQALNISSTAVSAGSNPSLTDPINPATAVADNMSVGGATLGFTQTEAITVTYHGELPGFEGRSGILSPACAKSGCILTLSDSSAQSTPPPFSATDCAPLPAAGGLPNPCVGDVVSLTDLSGTCSGIAGQYAITAIYPASGQIQLSAGANLSCGGGSSLPEEVHVAYDVLTTQGSLPAGGCSAAQRAAFDCGPWVVVGSVSGYMGRATTSNAFSYVGSQFYYECSTPNCGTGTAQAIQFTISQSCTPAPTSPCTAPPEPKDDGSYFILNTTSGFVPFEVQAEAYSTTVTTTTLLTGLTYGIVALPNDYLYMSIVAGNALAEINIPQYSLTDGSGVYQ